jgi:diguanylate cyclase (GGDEF)-like protein
MPSRYLHRRRFSRNIVLPVAMILFATAIGCVVFIGWTASSVDQRAIAKQRQIVTSVLAESVRRLAHEQESVAVWDDAVNALRDPDRIDWVHDNLGAWLDEYFGHDAVAIVDAAGEPVYLLVDGHIAALAEYGSLRRVVEPLAERLRADLDGGALDAYEYLSGMPLPVRGDIVVFNGRPAVASLVPVVGDSAAITQPRGSEYLHVSIKYLDTALSQTLEDTFLLEQARFSTRPTVRPEFASQVVSNSEGRIIGVFSWRPDLPGRDLVAQMTPVLAVGFIVATVVVALLLRGLWRSSSELEAGRMRAETLARRDRLTGLANRVAFDEALSVEVERAGYRRAGLNLLMLDLDRFKQINDTLGHQAGDRLLQRVGGRLLDLLGPDDLLARLGGDEFAIVQILDAEDGAHGAAALADAIIEAVSVPFEIDQTKAFIGVSIGIVGMAEGGGKPTELVRKADIALYEAKSAGRNRAIVYKEHMNELLQLNRTIEGELREALKTGEQFSVVFQPLIAAGARSVIGAEALVRWMHPEYGAIAPSRFIPVAESSGLIEALGELVLRRACRLGAEAPGRTISVNVSPTQLRNTAFTNTVRAILAETGMRAEDLEMEITEGILIEDDQASQHVLRSLRAIGIHIALDDFGTGYSSLSYLKRYPVDRIKIDRSFVAQLAEGHVSVAIVEAIVRLAHAMQIDVTAEGVETEQQAAILTRLGCNVLQGFLFSTPVSAEAILMRFAAAGPRTHPLLSA